MPQTVKAAGEPVAATESAATPSIIFPGFLFANHVRNGVGAIQRPLDEIARSRRLLSLRGRCCRLRDLRGRGRRSGTALGQINPGRDYHDEEHEISHSHFQSRLRASTWINAASEWQTVSDFFTFLFAMAKCALVGLDDRPDASPDPETPQSTHLIHEHHDSNHH
jgi:hypothetical protein